MTVTFLRFLAAAHTSRVNCDRMMRQCNSEQKLSGVFHATARLSCL